MSEEFLAGGEGGGLVRARALSAHAGKPDAGAPGYSRWVNRPLGRQLAIIAYQLRLTPNQVTVLSGLTSLGGIAVLAIGPATVSNGLVVAFLLALGYALDSADGQLARMRHIGSPIGEWLDHVVDCLKIVMLHMAVLICWYRWFDTPEVMLLVPILFTVQASTYFFSKVLTDQLRGSLVRPEAPAGGVPLPPSPSAGDPSGHGRAARPPVLASLVVLPMDYGLLCLCFVLLGFQDAFTWAYSAMAAAGVVLLVAAFTKWYRDLTANT